MTRTTGMILALLLTAAVAFANPTAFVWGDDMESGTNGWTTADLTASAAPHFHWDTYQAYEGHSWWCGTFDYDSDGGYGNGWDDRLVLPPVSTNPVAVENASWGEIKSLYRDGGTSGSGRDGRDDILPVLTFAFRHDSEIGYDYTYVQAESSGTYVNLNRGYDGAQDWTDLGAYGFDLSTYDDPLNIRFRFVSDGAYSDEDGDYLSDGGAFHVDNIRIFDFNTGEVLFYDSEPGGDEGECMPAVPAAAGDHWHIIDRACPAYSDPHSWWCGDDADTSLIPPNLANALLSPVFYTDWAVSCTLYAAVHFAIPTVDNDYFTVLSTPDGVEYYSIGGWWGDFGQCDGWATSFFHGLDIQVGPGTSYYTGVAFVMYTTDNGCGPGGGGDAGVMIDDVWICTNGMPPGWPRGAATGTRYAEPYGAAKSASLTRRLMHR